jgi:AraC-like DNA-binding protein
VQFKRLFKQQFDLTPLQYWERRRLESACLRLEADSLPIKAIATSLGFRGQSHFTVWFKRRAGVSPRHHRSRETHA